MQPWKNDMVRNQDSASWGEGAWNEIPKCLNILGESIINWNNYLFGVNEILETFSYLSSWTLFETLSSQTRHWPLTGMDITSVTIKPSTTKKMAKGLTNMTSILLSSSMAFSTSTVVSTWPHSQLDIRIYLVSLQAWHMTTLTNTVVAKDLVQSSLLCFSTAKNKVTKDVIKLFSFLTRGTSIRIFLCCHHLQFNLW